MLMSRLDLYAFGRLFCSCHDRRGYHGKYNLMSWLLMYQKLTTISFEIMYTTKEHDWFNFFLRETIFLFLLKKLFHFCFFMVQKISYGLAFSFFQLNVGTWYTQCVVCFSAPWVIFRNEPKFRQVAFHVRASSRK